MKIDKLLAKSIRKDFYTFVQKAFSELEGKSLGDQMYIAYICSLFQQLVDGDFRKMLVNLPGRHLKTFIGSICYPAFLLGTDPSLRIMIAAYDEDLAADISRQIRDVMQSSWYRQIFATRISNDHAKKNDFATTANGRVRAVSANGAITGRGGDVIIYDDPHNVRDWNDEQKLQNVKDQFERLLTRRNSPAKGVVVVICHRVSEDDLSAYILEKGDFKHVCLPLVAIKTKTYDIGYTQWTREKDTPLQPENYPAEEIDRLKGIGRGPSFWMHYQQGQGRNLSRGITFNDFKFVHTPPKGLARVISVDTSQKDGPNSSRNVIHVYETDGTSHYLIAMFAKQCSYKVLRQQLRKTMDQYGPCPVLIEDTARGSPLIEWARERQSASIEAISPGRRSKRERLMVHADTIRQGRIHLNERIDGVEEVAEEVVHYPDTSFSDHLDALTQYLDFIATKPNLRPPTRDSRAYAACVLASRPHITSTSLWKLAHHHSSSNRPNMHADEYLRIVVGTPGGAQVRWLK